MARNQIQNSRMPVPKFDVRDVLTVKNELVFKGQLLVVPAALRKELMAVVHRHILALKGVYAEHVIPSIGLAWQPSYENTSQSVMYA